MRPAPSRSTPRTTRLAQPQPGNQARPTLPGPGARKALQLVTLRMSVLAASALLSLASGTSRAESVPSQTAPPRPPQFRTALPQSTPAPEKQEPVAGMRAAIPERTAARRLDRCPDSDLPTLVASVRENHPAAPNPATLDRTAISHMLADLGETVQILEPGEVREEQESPFHADLPEERIGYLRLGSLTPDHVAELETALTGMLDRKISSIVLDLRATGPAANPETVAQLCRLFCPKGKVLFRIRKTRPEEETLFTARQDPVFRGVLAVLIGPETSGGTEAAAAVLRQQARALVVGPKTPGARALLADTTLPGGLTLRIATGTFELTEPRPGTEPDLAIPASPGSRPPTQSRRTGPRTRTSPPQ